MHCDAPAGANAGCRAMVIAAIPEQHEIGDRMFVEYGALRQPVRPARLSA
jgi:hypothetical protein